MGGGELAQSLLAAGLVDEVGSEHPPDPARIGHSGFPRSRHRVKLTLIECRSLDGGCIYANYTVRN